MSNIFEQTAFGQRGAVAVSNTSPVTGDFTAILILTTANFSALSWPELTGTFTGISLPAGMVIVGEIKGFTLSSGAVLAYK